MPTLTDDSSSSILEEYIQASINQSLFNKGVLQDEAIRITFRYRSVANFQYLEETGTSTLPSVHFLPLNKVSYEIVKYLYKLSRPQESEKILYEISNSVAEWLIDAPSEYLDFLANYIKNLPLANARILLAALSNAEFSTSNKSLLSVASVFIRSTDKWLAQTAATFLLTCGGTLGKDVLSEVLSTEEVPHSQLVKGISEILS